MTDIAQKAELVMLSIEISIAVSVWWVHRQDFSPEKQRNNSTETVPTTSFATGYELEGLVTCCLFRQAHSLAIVPTASERKGNNLKGLKDFDLKAKARIWP